jgi:hypothetical protein
MNDNNSSSAKDNQSRNISSIATVANSNSPKSSPKKELYVLAKDRIISEPKFRNEFLFENKYKSSIINQTSIKKPKSSSIYITGLNDSNEISSDAYRYVETTPSNNQDLPKPLSKKNSDLNTDNKITKLPIIYPTRSQIRKNVISPLFKCCEQVLSPKILNKVLYQQLDKERQSKNRLCKTYENANKFGVKPHNPKGAVVPDGPRDYVNKTKEINRFRYCMNLKTESIKRYNDGINNQIKSLDYTIKSMNEYKNNLENKLLTELNHEIRALDKVLLTEKLEDEELKNQLVKLKKENLNILSRITKNEQNKNQIEKWLELQIYIKEGIHIDDKNILNYVSKKYEGKLIIETPEEFNEVFKRKERKNIKLIETLNHLHEDKMVLFKELKEIEDSNVVDKETVMEVLEKEKLLSLLKMRNNDLLKEKREILKMSSNSPIIESSSASSSLSPLLLNKNRDKSSKNIINFGKIYKLIQECFNLIVENDKESTGDFENKLKMINSINIKSTKALSQMKVIEMSYTFLFYYKEENIHTHQKLYEKIMEQIDLSRKKYKSEKHKQEEKQRELELYKKLEAKKDRIIFRPRRQDLYSNLIIIEKMKKEEKKKNKNVKKDIDIYDFLYDIDEEK